MWRLTSKIKIMTALQYTRGVCERGYKNKKKEMVENLECKEKRQLWLGGSPSLSPLSCLPHLETRKTRETLLLLHRTWTFSFVSAMIQSVWSQATATQHTHQWTDEERRRRKASSEWQRSYIFLCDLTRNRAWVSKPSEMGKVKGW